jgi:(S)-citramalyl-CoA lyase
VAKARAILAENRKGVGTVDGQMIDEAIARKARRTLAAAGLEA